LTGLPNARLLGDRLSMALAHARRVGQMVAVVAVDLEGFRQVNEEHGPNVADEVLQQAARRLQRLSRDADTVARIRDDEFVMVLSDVKSRDHTAAFAERLINNVSGSYTTDGRDINVGAHVGVSLFEGQAASADDLTRQASAALWKAKNGGGRIELS
jgi:diguanylate cyclase (GGDEF)-like protein